MMMRGATILRTSSSRTLATLRDAYDVVVSGGGIVGTLLACNLALDPNLESSSKLLIEAQKEAPSVEKICQKMTTPDARVYALSKASIDALQAVGVWDTAVDARDGCGIYLNMQVWDTTSKSHIRFEGSDAPLGYVVEHGVLQSALAARLRQLSESPNGNLDMLCASKIVSLADPPAQSPPQPWLGLNILSEPDVPMNTSARLLVGADGAMSTVRRLAGLGSWGWEYQHHAVVATVKTSDDFSLTAWQRFLPTGPLALLPVWGGHTSIVWSTTPAEAKRLRQMDSEQFLEELNRAIHDPDYGRVHTTVPSFLEPLKAVADTVSSLASEISQRSAPFHTPPTVHELCGNRFSFPLSFKHATNYVCDRVALVGDAAHSVHPLAGQGLNMGLGDVTSLTEQLSNAASLGLDLGDPVTVLNNYESPQRARNAAMAGGVDAIKRVYDLPEPFSLIRGLGINLSNSIAPLKEQFAAVAQGRL